MRYCHPEKTNDIGIRVVTISHVTLLRSQYLLYYAEC